MISLSGSLVRWEYKNLVIWFPFGAVFMFTHTTCARIVNILSQIIHFTPVLYLCYTHYLHKISEYSNSVRQVFSLQCSMSICTYYLCKNWEYTNWDNHFTLVFSFYTYYLCKNNDKNSNWDSHFVSLLYLMFTHITWAHI